MNDLTIHEYMVINKNNHVFGLLDCRTSSVQPSRRGLDFRGMGKSDLMASIAIERNILK